MCVWVTECWRQGTPPPQGPYQRFRVQKGADRQRVSAGLGGDWGALLMLILWTVDWSCLGEQALVLTGSNWLNPTGTRSFLLWTEEPCSFGFRPGDSQGGRGRGGTIIMNQSEPTSPHPAALLANRLVQYNVILCERLPKPFFILFLGRECLSLSLSLCLSVSLSLYLSLALSLSLSLSRTLYTFKTGRFANKKG